MLSLLEGTGALWRQADPAVPYEDCSAGPLPTRAGVIVDLGSALALGSRELQVLRVQPTLPPPLPPHPPPPAIPGPPASSPESVTFPSRST